MKNWFIFIKERIPLIVYALLVGGIVSSSQIIAHQDFTAPYFALAFFGLFLFFAVLRMMDEVKDFDKDKVAHPERPLPRGVLSLENVLEAIKYLYGTMILIGIALTFIMSPYAGICYLVITFWLGLMYKEFFVPKWLNDRPLIYAISHQILMIAVAAFPALLSSKFEGSQNIFYLGLTMLGSFFTYEVCRKLDPKADPVLGTYLIIYGPFQTFLILLGCSTLAWFGAHMLNMSLFLIPLQFLVVLCYLLIFIKPEKYKGVEALATISLLCHLWCGPLSLLFNKGV
jgi:4-hydroxybenzoate polyprenyltransferase